MGKKVWTPIFTGLVMFLISVGARYAGDRLAEDHGKITVGHPILIGSTTYQEIEIENWSRTTLDGLQVIIPSSVHAASVSSTFPISIEEPKENTATLPRKRLVLGGIPPHQITRVIFPLTVASDSQEISLPNLAQIKFGSGWSDPAIDPWGPTLRELVVVPFITAVFYGLGFYYFEGLWTSRMKVAKEQSDRYEKRLEKTDKKLGEVNAAYLKHRLYLLARISDYSRELEFWRDVARKIILSEGTTKRQAEDLIDAVTRTLKTWGTTKTSNEFSAIFETAKMLTRPKEDNPD